MRNLPIVFGSLSLVLILIWSTSSIAHQLSVFAWVEGNSVLLEARLPKGKHPKLGDVLIFDGEDLLLLKTRLGPDGTASFPLENWETGLRIVVDIGHGHQTYWILTPYDIQQQRDGQQ
jgi:nickel transport protein